MQTHALARSARTAESPWLAGIFSTTIFLSAVLLFFIQPMFARMMLPRLGGTPSTWNTCVVFFQLTLLLGYLYAHFVCLKLNRWVQVVLHAALLLSALMTLPISAPPGSPPDSSWPVWWLLATLATSVGWPFLLLSSTAPLLQRWFTHASQREPYFLYAASNLGSLAGLLGYPFGIERLLTLADQSTLWTAGFLLLIPLIATCGFTAVQGREETIAYERAPAAETSPGTKSTTWRASTFWLLLAFIPSSLLLGVTTHISTDIASVPLLWVLPLSIYLLTFIGAFAGWPSIPQAYLHRAMSIAIVVAFGALIVRPPSWWGVALHLTTFAVVAFACHRELANRRPAPEFLTRFYLWVSVGGALGGAFNSLIAPFLFTSIVEYPLILTAAAFLRRPTESARNRPEPWILLLGLPLLVFGVVVASSALGITTDAGLGPMATAFWLCAALILAFANRPEPAALATAIAMVAHMALPHPGEDRVLFAARSFFGVHRVVEDTPPSLHRLWHGTTQHGWQRLTGSKDCSPTSYYHASGPIGQAFTALGPRARSVAVIGLGAGSLACFGRAGARWTFLEIDPVVERVARDPALFTYLRNSPADVAVIIGDGRLTLTDSRASSFDVIVVDAFSSDAIPVHLLTQEFIELALERLQPDGLLAFHISNWYFNLEPVLAASAKRARAGSLEQFYQPSGETDAGASRWLVMSREPATIATIAADLRWRQARPGATAWTDDFSNIFDVVAWTPGSATGRR